MRALYGAIAALGMIGMPLLAQAGRRGDTRAETIAASFRAFAPQVKTRADEKNFYVESDGMPNQTLMVGIRAWQQQVPLPQRYVGSNAWQFPLQPVPAAHPLSGKDHFFRGAMAIAADGVPIFNALNNRGEDSYRIGELDAFGGHCGRADDYHYHIAPLHLEEKVGKGKPIAYALDGYPLYGLTEPDGKPATGLDPFNGHTTAALGYHYHGTKTYPYLNGGFHGEVQEIDGQVDPQPRAQSPRPATPPLPGATITAFARPKPGSYALTYVIDGQTCQIHYHLEADGSYTFDYINPEGKTVTLNYPQRGGGGGGRQRRRNDDPVLVAAKPTDFQLASPVVENGGLLPKAFTCDGAALSPPVAWKNVPTGTKSLALVMHHLPPGGDEAPHVYWVAYNISPTTRAIPQNDKATGERGRNTINRRSDYAPPCSQGPGKKWYTLTLYALSSTLPEQPGLSRDDLLKAIDGKVLRTATLHVAYERAALQR